MPDSWCEFVVFSYLELTDVVEILRDNFRSAPTMIHVRGVVLKYPAGVSDAQLDQLALFAVGMDRDGILEN